MDKYAFWKKNQHKKCPDWSKKGLTSALLSTYLYSGELVLGIQQFLFKGIASA